MNSKASITRRGFTQILGAGAAFAALRPLDVVASSVRPSTPAPLTEGTSAAVVRLSSNENPYGPAAGALKAMTDGFSLAWRYPDEYYDELAAALAKLNNVPVDHILLGNGSGEILKVAAMAFSGTTRKTIVADPTFEAIGRHAQNNGSEVVKVPLTANYHHDLSKMQAASSEAGLIYVCNPNNPTASITPKAEVRAFLNNVPRKAVVLIDEAYHHYVETSDYESVMPLIKEYSNLVVARTFSKIYGMAGLRCGYCVARPENIQLMRTHQVWDSINIMAIVAALASLKDDEHVAQGRRSNRETRKYVEAELDKLRFSYIPSEANFMMIDLRREVRPIISSLRDKGVEVGRFFPPLPNFMRVTIGTRPQMETFLSTFRTLLA